MARSGGPESMDLGLRPEIPLTHYVTLGKLFHFSETQFPFCEIGVIIVPTSWGCWQCNWHGQCMVPLREVCSVSGA